MDYEYQNLADSPCLEWIRHEVGHSEMVNKNIGAMTYQPDHGSHGRCLTVSFDVELSGADKTLLDAIVADSLGRTWVYKDRVKIMGELLNACEPEVQLPRCMDAMDHNATFIAALDSENWALARSRAAAAVTAGDLIQADYDLIDSIVPENDA